MNRIYRTIFSRTLNAWVVVSEQAKACGKRGSVRLAGALVLAPVTALGAGLPTNGQIVSGQGTVTSNGKDMTINQSSNKLAIDWNSFDIGAGKSVTFAQPSSHSVALNRVTGGDASSILGTMNANGQVFLVNPNGILFGSGASVNVGALVASTLDLSVADFNKGQYRFKGNGAPASVVNKGTLTASDGGAVALLGGTVGNQGVIVANQGTVALAAGNAMTLDFAGDGLLNVQVDESVADALAENQQLIRADGGKVVLTASASDALLKTVVNNTGVIEAQTLGSKEGKIVLLGGDEGGTVQVAGTLDASAPTSGNGGFVETSGAHVQVASTAKISTKSATGKTGSWVIDPTNFNVSAGSASQTDSGIGADALSASLENTNVTLATVSSGTEDGDINVNAAVKWAADTQLTLNAHGDINVNAAITATGKNAGLALNHGGSATSATAAVGTDYNVRAPITLSGDNASLSINGQAYILVHSMAQLEAIDSSALTGRYALGQDLDAKGTTYRGAVVGSSGNRLTGTFAGLGHVISDLTVAGTSNFAGLFSYIGTGGVIRDIGLAGGSVSGGYGVGALAAYNVGGSIFHSYSTANVKGSQVVGGLVGTNYDAQSSVTDSYASGTVEGASQVGGLVGLNNGSVSSSYAIGGVKGTSDVGGLIGTNAGSVGSVYATGAVTGTTNVGGLVGANYGTITHGYWDAESTGQSAGYGLSTGTVASLSDVSGGRYSYTSYGNLGTWTLVENGNNYYYYGSSVYAATDASGHTWLLIEGQTRPFLASEYSTTIVNAHQLQLMAYNLSANYRLGADIDASKTSGSDLSDMWSSQGFSPIGGNSNGIGGYYGYGYLATFDGQDHTISNLAISSTNSYTVGLFGAVAQGALVKNVNLVNASISGSYQVGSLVGYNYGTVSQVSASGTVAGRSYVGGLVGWNYGTLSNAYASGVVTATIYAGGLVGVNMGTITNAYSNSAVSAATSYAGGIAGYSSNSIDYSYALGTVTGNYSGGIVGVGGGNTSNSFYATTDVQGNAINIGLTASGSGNLAASSGKTYAELTDLTTFTDAGWNIDGLGGTGTTWRIYDGNSTPLLRSFLTAVTLTPDLSNVGKIYDGSVASGNVTAYTSDVSLDQNELKGTFGYTTSGDDAGTYSTGAGTLQVGGELYSTQTGYDITIDANASLTIAQKTLTAQTIASNKVYDGTTDADLSTWLSGVINNDAINLAVAGSFADKNAGSNKLVNVTTALSGADSGNYVLSSNATTTATITPALLSGAITAGDKTYDGSLTATTQGSLAGVIGNDDVGLTTSGSFADKNAGSGKLVNLTASLAGSDAGNYLLLNNATTTASIGQKALTGVITSADKTYDGTATAATQGSLDGVVSGDDVALATSGSFVDKNAGSGKTVNVSGSLEGSDAGNYSVTSNSTTLAGIVQKALAGVITASGKTYDGTTSAVTQSTLDGVIAGDSVALATSGSFADKNAGNGKQVNVTGDISGTDAGNYLLSSNATTTADIAQKAISGVITASGKTYDGTTGAATQGALDGVIAGDSVALATSGSFADKNAGSGKQVNVTGAISGTDAGNYLLSSNATATADIAQKAISGVITASGKTYDGTTSAATQGTLNGLIAGDSVALATSGSFADKNAGSGKQVNVTGAISGIDAGNYLLSSNATTTADIAQASLTIGANDASKTAGEGLVLSGYDVTGLLSGDSVSDVSLNSSGAGSDAEAGNYVITASNALGVGLGNYAIQYKNGQLTVAAAPTTPVTPTEPTPPTEPATPTSPVASAPNIPYQAIRASNQRLADQPPGKQGQPGSEPQNAPLPMSAFNSSAALASVPGLEVINNGIRLPEGM